jgi:hypothetical protein
MLFTNACLHSPPELLQRTLRLGGRDGDQIRSENRQPIVASILCLHLCILRFPIDFFFPGLKPSLGPALGKSETGRKRRQGGEKIYWGDRRYSHLAPKHTLAAVERLDVPTATPTDTTTDTEVLDAANIDGRGLQQVIH